MNQFNLYMVCPNPALDLSGHVDKIILDEKNYVTEARVDPGGNAINAARIARRLGANPVLLGFAGGGTGEQLLELMARERLNERMTKIHGDTRVNVTVTNSRTKKQTRLTFPGPRISRLEKEDLLRKIRAVKGRGILILGGSRPNQFGPAFNCRLIQAAQAAGFEAGADVPPQDLKVILQSRVDRLLLIKPNKKEFEAITGKTFRSNLQIAKEALKLNKRCEIVCVSLGPDGAIVAWNDCAWHVVPPKVPVHGSVGAGDSFVGGFLAYLSRSISVRRNATSILNATKLGVAAGAATVSEEGTSLGKASRVRSLFKEVKAHRLI